MTAREILDLFYPAHGMHSVAHASKKDNKATITCSCGTKKLVITETKAKREKLTMQAVFHALRNTPFPSLEA